MRFIPNTLLVCLICTLSACGELPSQGPTVKEIIAPQEDKASPEGKAISDYEVVVVDQAVLGRISKSPTSSFVAKFGNGIGRSTSIIGIGDTVAVTIWESGPGGLFSTRPATDSGSSAGGMRSTIPGQVLGRDGGLSIPYAGRIQAKGLTPQKLEAIIIESLAGKAINPQVVVTVTDRVSGTVNIIGQNVTRSNVQLFPGGDRILDVIARSGAGTADIEETEIRLNRGARSVSMPFEYLLRKPVENIYVHPNDVLVLSENPNELTVFGASGSNKSVRFGPNEFSLAQTLANAGGLLDNQADPEGVFVYRLVSKKAASGKYEKKPVIYQFDMNQGGSLFHAKQFSMRDGDIVYVATARANALQKFIAILSGVRTEISAVQTL